MWKWTFWANFWVAMLYQNMARNLYHYSENTSGAAKKARNNVQNVAENEPRSSKKEMHCNTEKYETFVKAWDKGTCYWLTSVPCQKTLFKTLLLGGKCRSTNFLYVTLSSLLCHAFPLVPNHLSLQSLYPKRLPSDQHLLLSSAIQKWVISVFLIFRPLWGLWNMLKLRKIAEPCDQKQQYKVEFPFFHLVPLIKSGSKDETSFDVSEWQKHQQRLTWKEQKWRRILGKSCLIHIFEHKKPTIWLFCSWKGDNFASISCLVRPSKFEENCSKIQILRDFCLTRILESLLLKFFLVFSCFLRRGEKCNLKFLVLWNSRAERILMLSNCHRL